ncbi:E3 ubiquitin-protein ligase RNF144A-like [Herrania umbratica]|uniref:RBR-type E3 ubiquitin transferase n=1 Tax=Herrania umbratica TaxID=108875 RepID=A0A6J0ZQ55_9ROSI|nr:E3 ubiquitin-protein ligase RNF144A-like [Herrania umbratica]
MKIPPPSSKRNPEERQVRIQKAYTVSTITINAIDEEASEKKRKMERTDFPQQVEVVDLETDLFSFTAITDKGNTKKNAISVEQYSEQRDIQLAIKASMTTSDDNYIDLDIYDDDLFVLNFEPLKTPSRKKRGKRKKPFSDCSITEPGESSNSKAVEDPPFICEICIEPRQANESFNIKGCSHAYCKDCMIKYVASKVQNKITAITCPVANCEGLLEPEYCRNILPREVFDRWGDALCEATILGSERFYCPFKECSTLLIDDGGQAVRESQCPNCRRLFCAQCKVPWHAGVECGEFQRLHTDERQREDILLMKLAKDKKWARCPTCRFVVERTEGCRYMRCRCGSAFCYDCGSTQMDSHHYCHKCKR